MRHFPVLSITDFAQLAPRPVRNRGNPSATVRDSTAETKTGPTGPFCSPRPSAVRDQAIASRSQDSSKVFDSTRDQELGRFGSEQATVSPLPISSWNRFSGYRALSVTGRNGSTRPWKRRKNTREFMNLAISLLGFHGLIGKARARSNPRRNLARPVGLAGRTLQGGSS